LQLQSLSLSTWHHGTKNVLRQRLSPHSVHLNLQDRRRAQGQRNKMPAYQYPNLTIIEEGQLQRDERDVFQAAVIFEVPPSAMHIIGHEEINNAIHQQLRVDINVQDISKFGSNYFIKTNCQQTTAPMLQHTFLKVGSHTLTLKPWNPYYNAIIFPCETQTTNLRFTNLANSSQRTLTVQISGIPPHLCCDFTVNRLLSEICTIHTISFEPATLSLN